MSDFNDYLMEVLGGMKIIPPRSSIDVTPEIDQEGKRIARTLNARYMGFNYNLFWLNDNKTDSSYVAKSFEDAIIKRDILWKRFNVLPQNN